MMSLNSAKKFWTPEEDHMLHQIVQAKGAGKWSKVASQIPGRTSKQCRERWRSHLNANVRKGNWTPEDDIILNKHIQLGNQWTCIAEHLQGRTDLDVKNRFFVIQRAIKRSSKILEPLGQSVNLNIDHQQLTLVTTFNNFATQDNSYSVISSKSDITDSESRKTSDKGFPSSNSSFFTFQRYISYESFQTRSTSQFNYCTVPESHSFEDLVFLEKSSNLSSIIQATEEFESIDNRNILETLL